jgi:hypothetical protein
LLNKKLAIVTATEVCGSGSVFTLAECCFDEYPVSVWLWVPVL